MTASKQNSSWEIRKRSNQVCEWVKAGILTYKLCDRKFDCENCPLDKILRGETNLQVNGRLNLFNYFSSLRHLLKIKADERFYISPKHSWIKVDNSHHVKIGFDDIIAIVLGSIEAVILPAIGEKIEKGKSCCQIIQDEFVFSLPAPLSGKVVEVNQDLKSFPNEATLDPLNKGWLLKISPTDLSQHLEECRTGENLLNWYLQEINWVEQKLEFIMHKKSLKIGATMADGGELSREIRRSVSANDYRFLVNYLLGNPYY
ncbi:MAG: glycine cleavage system protein H [Calditrichaeota bacterium]|nr:glycine cleavage system protein H [Calditrichota bacterium]